ncbi:hypothetical protein BH09PSE5_BH09PSE5_44480 [soil metagenome]
MLIDASSEFNTKIGYPALLRVAALAEAAATGGVGGGAETAGAAGFCVLAAEATGGAAGEVTDGADAGLIAEAAADGTGAEACGTTCVCATPSDTAPRPSAIAATPVAKVETRDHELNFKQNRPRNTTFDTRIGPQIEALRSVPFPNRSATCGQDNHAV